MPISTPGYDSAPYLTATLCITQDPETGIRNMGTYRAALKATDRLGVRMAARPGGAGGYLHWQKYRKLKKPMPIAIVVGAAPVVMFTGPQKLPIDCDEMAVAGGLAGAPIRIVKAATVDLDVPADAEFVVEGLIDPELLEPEGPFGESHGHVALEGFNMSMQVTAITHKRAPVWASILSEVTPSESSVMKRVAYEPRYLAYLRDTLAIKGVRRVVMHEPLTNLRKVVFVQFAPGVPRTEIWRALQGAATLQADIGKYVIAVSEDIDPDNADAVFWSLAYRANPIEDVHIIPLSLGGAWAEIGRAERRFDHADRRHAEGARPADLAAQARIHGARAGDLAGTRPAGAHAAAAVARLFARRLGRGVGHLCEPGRRRPLGRDRQGNLRPPPRRTHAGNAGEEREGIANLTAAAAPYRLAPASRLSPARWRGVALAQCRRAFRSDLRRTSPCSSPSSQSRVRGR